MKVKDSKNFKFATVAIHAGQHPDPLTGAVMPPVYQTSTFAQSSPGVHKGYDYSRADNPTREQYEHCLAGLERADYGLAFSSGLSAIDAILRQFSPGDHIICGDDVYGGTYRLFTKFFEKQGYEFSFIDLGDLKKVEAEFKPNTRLIWLETPTNPLLKIFDIESLAKLTHSKKAMIAVDNTFMSPYFQNPLLLGADLVMHSVTKFINGHSDVIGGAIALNDQAFYEKLKFTQLCIGAVPAPWDCFLVLRGIKTLHLRMREHEKNAIELATFLESHPKVDRVIYPGLKSHPQHELAKKQMHGFGGMITFFLKGGLPQAKTFLEKVKIFTLAESLGGVESLIEHPAIMTHASVPPENRAKLGILDTLIRVSVGVEDLDDLKSSLQAALNEL